MIKKIITGELETNCYIIYSNQEAIIIDPGDDVEVICKFLDEKKLKPKFIVNTHAHSDHIGGNSMLKKIYDLKILTHYFDAPMLTTPEMNFSIFVGKEVISPPADKLIDENDVITCGDISLKVLHTPGHTKGSISLLGNDFIFTGDTLFCGSVGRWDLPGGNEKILMSSIKKIISLDKNLRIYPGHGPDCTISGELQHNPFCQEITYAT